MSGITKYEAIMALEKLSQGIKNNTLKPSEWILVGELIEWHRWIKGEKKLPCRLKT